MKFGNKILAFCLLSGLFFACNRIKEKTKDVVNASGETVGKTATEFAEGVSEGIDQTLECEITLSPKLTEAGLKTGKFSVHNDSLGNKDNVFTVYFIFEKNFKNTVLLKVTDKNNIETGRIKMEVTGNKGDAMFFDFVLDQRSRIEARSKIQFSLTNEII